MLFCPAGSRAPSCVVVVVIRNSEENQSNLVQCQQQYHLEIIGIYNPYSILFLLKWSAFILLESGQQLVKLCRKTDWTVFWDFWMFCFRGVWTP